MLLPTCCCGVSNLDQEVARDLVKPTELIAQSVRRIEELSVDVELALILGAVADAHRTAGTPSRQVVERAFAQIALTTDSEHNLQFSLEYP